MARVSSRPSYLEKILYPEGKGKNLGVGKGKNLFRYTLLMSTDGKGEENTAIRQRLRSTKEQGERTPLQMPLRELQQPPVQDAWGTTISSL